MRVRLERPESNFLDVNPFVADENFGDAAISWVMARLAGALSQNPVLGHSHAVYLLVRQIEALAKSKGNIRSNKHTTIDSLFALPAGVVGDGEKVFATQLGLFRKYQSGMEAIARDYGVKTAYFFHPVPAWHKTLTPAEQAAVGDLSYGPLYRRMVDAMMKQRDDGLPVFDLGDLLIDIKETIYADGAHFERDPNSGESLGYRLMARQVAADLAQAWGLQRKL